MPVMLPVILWTGLCGHSPGGQHAMQSINYHWNHVHFACWVFMSVELLANFCPDHDVTKSGSHVMPTVDVWPTPCRRYPMSMLLTCAGLLPLEGETKNPSEVPPALPASSCQQETQQHRVSEAVNLIFSCPNFQGQKSTQCM